MLTRCKQIRTYDTSSFHTSVRRKVILNHSNIADKMVLQEERARRRHGWHMDEAELDIVHIMTYMRQRLTNSSVFLVEFFRDADAGRFAGV